jgi:4-alpha-glucanotransferase
VNPLYLRIEEVPEYAAAPEAVRARVDALRLPPPDPGGLLDRDQVWTAKIGALKELWPDARPVAADPDLLDFATFCALAERYGLPWQNWPAELRRPDAAGLPAAREQLADRVAFHAWVQVLCDEQVAAVQQAALDAGMRIGIVHDLAVGVDPGGADAWALQDVLAGQVTVGAPPDSFNQRGQDWALPPWRPDALLRTQFAPYRQMLTAILARGGGIRVDHVMGLSRLWWVPPGHTPDAGTYVSYDETALLDLLVEVATSRGGIVVGEDLGTVEPRMRTALRERGVLGSAVLWFERVDDRPDGPPKPPSAWSELAVASISTHDLPTAHGWLADEQVRVRAELGQLGRPVEQERAAAGAERTALLTALTQLGLLAPAELDDPDVVVLAMHAYLAASPALVLLASPYDVIGELRQPNLPGTTDEYPNWRLPLGVSLDALLDDPRVARTATVLRRGRDLA